MYTVAQLAISHIHGHWLTSTVPIHAYFQNFITPLQWSTEQRNLIRIIWWMGMAVNCFIVRAPQAYNI